MIGQKNTPIVGIDISSSAIKLLEFVHKGKLLHVKSYAVEPLPPGAVIEGRIEKPEEVSEAVKRALKRSGSKAKKASVAVSSNAGIIKILTLPAMLSEREMEENVLLEAENYVPYPLAEVSLDFSVVGPVNGRPDAVEVLLAASRVENVDTRVSTIEEAGLSVTVVDLESLAMENAVSIILRQLDLTNESVIAIADVGATQTTLHVMINGRIIFTRDQSFGGLMLTEEIERHYGMSYQEAGRAKKDPASLPEDYTQKVLQPFTRSLTTTVTRALQFFFSASSQIQSIDQLILAGGCASIRGIDEMIQAETGIPTQVANPFVDMSIAENISTKKLLDDAPAMMVACGLALRGVN